VDWLTSRGLMWRLEDRPTKHSRASTADQECRHGGALHQSRSRSRQVHCQHHRVRQCAAGIGSEVIKAVAARLQYIPEEFVGVAVRRAPLLLDALLATDLPIQSLGSYWRAGENTSRPASARARGCAQQRLRPGQKLQQLFSTRRVSPPKEHFAASSYGTWERGFEITRAVGVSFRMPNCYCFRPAFATSF